MLRGRILPEIPASQRERFEVSLRRAGTDSLLVGALLLAFCYAVEAFGPSPPPSPELFWIPLGLSIFSLVFAVSLYRGWFRPKYVAFWQLVMLLTPFALTLYSLRAYSMEKIWIFLAIEMVGLCVLIPFAWPCLLGATLVGAALLFVPLVGEGATTSLGYRSDLFSIYALSIVAYVGRQRGIRHAFLRETELAAVNHELYLTNLALDQTSHFVIRIERSGKLSACNQSVCQALGYSLQDIVAKPFDQLSADWTSKKWTQFVDELIESKSACRSMRLLTRDGSEVAVDMQFDLVEWNGQIMVCAVGVDLADRQRLDEEIERVQRLDGLATLAGGVAHDYNNLLVPIVTNAQLMCRELPSDDPAQQRLQAMLTASERAAALTRQLLVYSGKATSKKVSVDVTAELESISKLLKSALPKGVDLVIESHQAMPPVLAEAGQLHQVLLNLVINAGQAIGDRMGGKVQISVGQEELSESAATRLDPPMPRASGNYVVCSVQDNGCGISPEDQRRMFHPFFTSKPGGRGLGLSAVSGILRSFAGGIVVDSEVANGTTVQVYLPVPAIPVATPRPQIEPKVQDPPVVLFVDDVELIRTTAKQALESRGCRVHLSASGDEALEFLSDRLIPDEVEGFTSPVDVIVLDNQMPGMSLSELIREIRRLLPDVPIVLCSGYVAGIPSELRLGETRFPILEKPYGVEELTRAVFAAGGVPSGHPSV